MKMNTSCHVLSVVHTQKTIPNGHLKLNQARNIRKNIINSFWFWWRLGKSDGNNLDIVLCKFGNLLWQNRDSKLFFIFIYSPSMALNAKNPKIKVMAVGFVITWKFYCLTLFYLFSHMNFMNFCSWSWSWF